MFDAFFNRGFYKRDSIDWDNIDLRTAIGLYQLFNQNVTSDDLIHDFGLSNRVMVSRKLKADHAKIEEAWHDVLDRYAQTIDYEILQKTIDEIRKLRNRAKFNEEIPLLGDKLKAYAASKWGCPVTCCYDEKNDMYVIKTPTNGNVWLMSKGANLTRPERLLNGTARNSFLQLFSRYAAQLSDEEALQEQVVTISLLYNTDASFLDTYQRLANISMSEVKRIMLIPHVCEYSFIVLDETTGDVKKEEAIMSSSTEALL